MPEEGEGSGRGKKGKIKIVITVIVSKIVDSQKGRHKKGNQVPIMAKEKEGKK